MECWIGHRTDNQLGPWCAVTYSGLCWVRRCPLFYWQNNPPPPSPLSQNLQWRLWMNGTPLQYCTAAQDRPTLSDRFWGAATSCLNVLILAHIVLFVTAVLRTVAESFFIWSPIADCHIWRKRQYCRYPVQQRTPWLNPTAPIHNSVGSMVRS